MKICFKLRRRQFLINHVFIHLVMPIFRVKTLATGLDCKARILRIILYKVSHIL